MVLISGLTLALVVLIIAGAAATTPKDTSREQKMESTSLAHEMRAEDLTEATQTKRAKRAHGNLIPSPDDEEEAIWAPKGHRLRIGDLEEVPEAQQGPADPIILRPYGPRWALPQRATADEDEEPYAWESRGRRCCGQVKGVMDLKRGYGKDRVKALVAKIIAGSGGSESEDAGGGEEDVFWAARGKRRRGQAEEAVREPRSRL
ncbi:uncharacterized protein LOC124160760 [Ischnura elegans]|uniref:uncharacterized protein LOC124160760 n=1 Tax=Ischnura elegans TaxID=197161 RepID=UPI001ED88CE0|nr:uncharacterized protein LOC124160760 [Ischnura elegans]